MVDLPQMVRHMGGKIFFGILCLSALAVIVYLDWHEPPIRHYPVESRNVVFILLDTLRADRLNAERNGIPVMPNLARLAKESLNFTHAITQCSWTKPAMASIFTGLYFDTHKVHYSVDPEYPDSYISDVLPDSMQTMASYLRRAGYNTVGLQTNGNLKAEVGFGQGFDEYEFVGLDESADIVTAAAIRKVRKLRPPFFLYVHYMDPHLPHDPPEKYRKLFGPAAELTDADKKLVENFMDYFWDQVSYFWGMKDTRSLGTLSQAGIEALKALYDAEVRFMDDELSKLITSIKKRYQNTLFVIVSDHGEEMWDHGSLGHGTTMYHEQVHVPFLIFGPGIEPREIDTTVELFCILPTVAAHLGLEPDPAWQGTDLMKVITSDKQLAFSHTRASWPRVSINTEMVLQGNHKLVVRHTSNTTELYDLPADPNEKVNIASERSSVAAELETLLGRHREMNLAHVAHPDGDQKVALDDETVEQLRAIGYIKD